MRGARFAVAIAGSLLFGLAALADDYAVTVRGSFFCHNAPGGPDQPLAGARVELMDSDCAGSEICDDVLGTGYVRADGSFEVRGSGGDVGSWSWSRPDVYVRVLYTDDRLVRLTDEVDQLRGVSTPYDEHDDFEGVLDIGSWLVGGDAGSGESPPCGVFLRSKRSVDDYVAVVGSDPPAGKYDVLYWSGVFDGSPWTSVDTTHWPIHYATGGVNDHEFAHSVRHSLDGDLAHFSWDVVRFRYARNHEYCDSKHLAETRENREGFAFNEGWAEYWEGRAATCTDPADMEVEGNVAAALARLAACPGVGKPGMVAVLRSAPGAIHSYGEFLAQYQLLLPSCGTGTTASSLTSGEPERPPLERSIQLAWAKQDIARIDRVIAALRSQLGAARSAAGLKAPCDPKGDCGSVIDARVRPAMLEGRIAHATLARDHIARTVEQKWGSALGDAIAEGRLEAFLRPVRADYAKRSHEIARTAFRDALRALGELPADNAQARLVGDELKRKAAEFERLAAGGKSLPPQFAPREAVFTEAVARRAAAAQIKPRLKPQAKPPVKRPPR